MKSNIYYTAIIILSLIFTSVINYPQEVQTKKEEYKQSLLEKYSSYLNKENEILTLRTINAQHFKINDSLYIAKIFSSPITALKNENSFYKTDADTTLTAPASGKVFKDGGTITKFDNTLRIQNTDAYGCENGYRSWVKYDISSMPNSASVVQINQYIYCTELVEGIFDLLNYNIIRVDYDPVTATPGDLWTDIYEGAMYEYNEWVTNPPGWEWCILNSPAPMDFTNALNNEDWFALGYMVKCDEDDSDYRAIFNGYLDPNPPYLIVSYNIVTGIEDFESELNSFTLYQNYPNPFNPNTTIRFRIPSAGIHSNIPVQLKVYDVLGVEIVTLINEEKSAGVYEINFNASNFASGIYLYTLRVREFISTKKMILMK